jgi:hypothetical protein
MNSEISGKILRQRKSNNVFYTTVITPSTDSYSPPHYVEIRSKSKIDDSDEEITVRVKIGGFLGRPYTFTDKDSGESKTAKPVQMFLELLE